jgi:hypothetical protein
MPPGWGDGFLAVLRRGYIIKLMREGGLPAAEA